MLQWHSPCCSNIALFCWHSQVTRHNCIARVAALQSVLQWQALLHRHSRVQVALHSHCCNCIVHTGGFEALAAAAEQLAMQLPKQIDSITPTISLQLSGSSAPHSRCIATAAVQGVHLVGQPLAVPQCRPCVPLEMQDHAAVQGVASDAEVQRSPLGQRHCLCCTCTALLQRHSPCCSSTHGAAVAQH